MKRHTMPLLLSVARQPPHALRRGPKALRPRLATGLPLSWPMHYSTGVALRKLTATVRNAVHHTTGGTTRAVSALALQNPSCSGSRSRSTVPCLQTRCNGAESVKGRKRVQDQRSTGAEATSLNARSFVPSGSTERGARPRSPMRACTRGQALSRERVDRRTQRELL